MRVNTIYPLLLSIQKCPISYNNILFTILVFVVTFPVTHASHRNEKKKKKKKKKILHVLVY